ncbi:hypothetical protein [Comamonas sp. JUb58]|uniref:hypothetical protein n=1 Tax=Comamonas sp. JUb58 TaxID=2485114 RepID=UPI00105DB097|nr:hypothetical protein [Comamonas sp. JUb58]
MSKQEINCMLCGHSILDGEARFYFPRLPPNHPLADLKGVLHTSCLISENASKRIGDSLAEIAEWFAKKSDEAPLLVRNGNVVARDRVAENRIEVLDFEDFCEISIPRAALDQLRNAAPGSAIPLGMQVLHVKEHGELLIEHKSPAFNVELPALGLNRLLSLVGSLKA